MNVNEFKIYSLLNLGTDYLNHELRYLKCWVSCAGMLNVDVEAI